MTLVQTLMHQGRIKSGTWVGVKVSSHMKHMVVHQIAPPDQVLLQDPRDLNLYKVHCDHICEVDGMQLHRYCAQADLNPDGTPIQNLTRRGRKRKTRS